MKRLLVSFVRDGAEGAERGRRHEGMPQLRAHDKWRGMMRRNYPGQVPPLDSDFFSRASAAKGEVSSAPGSTGGSNAAPGLRG